jgi:replicative DNA helicase
MTIGIEKIFFGYILQNKKYFYIVEPFYFKNNEIQFVYDILKKYMTAEGDIQLPSPKQILEMVSLEDRDGMITRDILKSILTVNLDEYDELNFILPRFNSWILSNRVKAGTVDIIEQTRNLDAIADFESTMVTVEKIKEIVQEMSSTNFVGDDEDMGSDFDDVEAHVQDSSKFKVKTGFTTLDHMLGGGWDVGTLNILMGETNSGKCTFADTRIVLRNKETKNIIYMNIERFFSKISKTHDNF